MDKLKNKRESNMKKLKVSWKKLNNDILALAKMIQEAEFDDCDILAISRGGLVPASMLSHYTNNQHIEVIGVKAYNNDATRAPRIATCV